MQISNKNLEPERLFKEQLSFEAYDDERSTPMKKSFNNSQNNSNQKSIFEDENENMKSVNDIVDLDFLPWQNSPEDYALALTGKAFNILATDPT